MEQGKKNCPYCGEEIMATAKKCRHCGEWLFKVSPKEALNKPVYKEADFSPKQKYDRTILEALFWVTIAGSLIQTLHQSGVASDIVVRGTIVTRFVLGIIKFFSTLPEALGDLMFCTGEIIFIYLLMKAMSSFHKPLKNIFWGNLVLYALVLLFMLMGDFNDNENIIILLFLSLFLIVLLGIKIILNYDGVVKRTGWVIIIYSILSAVIGLIEEFVAYPIIYFLISFFVDYYYIKYLRDVLSK
jgi:hypothetical protein